MKKFFIKKTTLFFFIIIISTQTYALKISEVMYNPEGNDAGREWIEIYNNDSFEINITKLKVVTDGTRHSMKNFSGSDILETSEFAIITNYSKRFLADYPQYTGNIYEYSFSLSNTNDTISIENQSEMIDFLSYTDIAKEGYSIEVCNNHQMQGPYFGSAGRDNECNAIINNSENESKNVTKNNTDILNCNNQIRIFSDKEVYSDNETISFWFSISNDSFSFIIEYWVEDLFGNTLKPKYNTTNLAKKSFSPDIIEEDRIFVIKAILYFECGNNTIINSSEKNVIMKKEIKKDILPSIKIKEVYLGSDNKVSFGEQLRVRVIANKGNSTKSEVVAYLFDGNKKISDTPSLMCYEKNTDYDFTFSMQLIPNCDNKFSDGEYSLFVEGFGISANRTINVSGVKSYLCKTVAKKSSSSSSFSSSTKTYSKKGIEYKIEMLQKEIYLNEDLNIYVTAENNDDYSHSVRVWSYIYKASKCYSCNENREENSIILNIVPKGSASATLVNKVGKAENGTYSVKVKAFEDESKEREFTYSIKIINKNTNPVSSNQKANSPVGAATYILNSNQNANQENKKTTQYESISEKLRKNMVLMLAGLFLLVCLMAVVGMKIK